MNNPLLKNNALPPFNEINVNDIEPAIKYLIEQNRSVVGLVLSRGDFSWEGLVRPMNEAAASLFDAWSPVAHLHSVKNTSELRKVYQTCLPLISSYETWLGQHTGLYKAYKILRSNNEYPTLNEAQRESIDIILLNFRLAGVGLPAEKKKHLAEIQTHLSKCCNAFSNNVLDATQAWQLVIDESRLSGIPQNARETLRANAERKGVEGYCITLDFPSFNPVLSYADDRELRYEVYAAFVTRASDTGPRGGEFDNSDLIAEILTLRHEAARLLGFDCHAERALANRMAESPDQVIEFLTDLLQRTKSQATGEFEEMSTFARENLGMDELHPWDISYVSEKLRHKRYAVSDEQLRAYFPAPTVINGLFEVTKRLYNIDIHECFDVDKWHSDVNYYEVVDNSGGKIAGFYLDLYAREGKSSGAWMNSCRTRQRRINGELQLPIAYLVCNFTRPLVDKPALLTHGEVMTLFHEFGHGLHHMLTQQEVVTVSGINGVAWDAVELPSQFMESFCWEREIVDLLSAHAETNKKLPDDLYKKLLSSKNFQSAMRIVRQIEYGLFDFRAHIELKQPKCTDVQQLMNDVRERVAVIPHADFNRFQHSFQHIFSGSYSAGYYSYLWAEVLSADVYALFIKKGLFTSEISGAFREEILGRGGSRKASELFRAFSGREPDIKPLLRRYGIISDKSDVIEKKTDNG